MLFRCSVQLDGKQRVLARLQVHAILVQLPLPEHIDAPFVLSKIRVDKDLPGPLIEVSSFRNLSKPSTQVTTAYISFMLCENVYAIPFRFFTGE